MFTRVCNFFSVFYFFYSYTEGMTLDSVSTPMNNFDNETLLSRLYDGDLEALSAIIDRFQHSLLNFAGRMLSDRDEAEDIVQDTFIKVWNQRSSVTEVTALSAWLYTMTKNACLDVLRKRSRHATESHDPATLAEVVESLPREASAGQSPAFAAEFSATVNGLQQVLDDLPVEQKTAWLLYEVQGASYSEIASIMSISTSSVRGKIYRARLAITEKMAAWK